MPHFLAHRLIHSMLRGLWAYKFSVLPTYQVSFLDVLSIKLALHIQSHYTTRSVIISLSIKPFDTANTDYHQDFMRCAQFVRFAKSLC
jgi:hypothetical protein